MCKWTTQNNKQKMESETECLKNTATKHPRFYVFLMIYRRPDKTSTFMKNYIYHLPQLITNSNFLVFPPRKQHTYKMADTVNTRNDVTRRCCHQRSRLGREVRPIYQTTYGLSKLFPFSKFVVIMQIRMKLQCPWL